MLGHLFKKHGSGIHPPSALIFKDLRASWYMRVGSGPGEGRGRRGGRRGGRTNEGRGGSNPTPRSFAGEDSAMGQEVQTVNPETGDVDMLDPNRKRSARTELPPATVVTGDGSAVNPATLADGNQLAIVPIGTTPLSPPPKRDPKKAKTTSDGKDVNSAATKGNLAGPGEGHRRAQ